MFLAMQGIGDIIRIPFGYLMDWLYQFTTNYGLALILFAVLVKLILLYPTAKGKKSSMKMSRLQPRVQALQKKYEGDQQKQNEAVQALYKEEGVKMGGGCLWSLLPLFLLLPLYAVVRQPIQYMLHATGLIQESITIAETVFEADKASVAEVIVAYIKDAAPALFGKNDFYDQMIAAAHLGEYSDLYKDLVAHESSLESLKFTFLGIDLSAIPNWKFWQWSFENKAQIWPTVGGVLIALLSCGSQIVSMLISQKMNNSLITDDKGLEDKETAKASQTNQSSKIMMWMMPLMSLWIGFTIPAALSLYWFAQGIVSTIIDVILTKRYRKIYDAEDAVRLQRALEQEAIEAEKERLRAERRAANPDGITQNTSKKKLQQKQQQEKEAAKAAAKKEYDAKKGIVVEEDETAVKTALSGIAERPYCKGRAYDPNRYATENTEE